MYSQKIMQHFVHPKNAGAIKKPDATGKALDEDNGCVVKFFLKVNNESSVIDLATFKTLGSPVAIACCDVVCDMLKDKNIDEAEQLTSTDIINAIGGGSEIPVEKVACLSVIVDAIKDAIKNYRKNAIKIKNNYF